MKKLTLKDAKREIDPLRFPITITFTQKDQQRYHDLRGKLKKKKLKLSELSRKSILRMMKDIEDQL